MKNRAYNEYNASPVLERLEAMIEDGYSRPIRMVYDELSIFDWWPERLTLTHMKQMRAFLREAVKLGYDGYVCFKVGASGCANGMWAYKKETTDGYSPDGEAIYRSFTPDYTEYSFCDKNGSWHQEYKNTKELEQALASI